MIYTINSSIPGASAAWRSGSSKPKVSQSDDFVRLRLSGILAGARTQAIPH